MKTTCLINISTIILLALAPDFNYAQNGVYHNIPLEVNGTLRAYRLYIPEGYNGTDELALVFCFHGFGKNALQFPGHPQLYDIADTAQFFILYPQGLVVQDLVFGGSGTGWNIPGNYLAEHNEIEFMNAMIDDILANPIVNVDESRIHATGHSSGAEMAYYLACAWADKVASVAGVNGQMAYIMMDSLCTPERPVSVWHSLGTEDPFFPANGNEYFPPLEGTAEYWAFIDGCDTIPMVIDLPDLDPNDGSTVSLMIYNNCNSGLEVLCYRVESGLHIWPGSGYPANNDINAGVEMWEFFKRNPHPDIITTKEEIQVSPFSIWPNPCSGSINLQISNTEQGMMICDVFDVSGIKIKSIINEIKLPGTHEKKVDLSDQKPGAYLCILQTTEYTETKKIIKLP